MQERIKQIPVRLLEIWKKYSKKQRVIIVSILSALIFTLVLLILILGRTQYVELAKFEDVSTASKAVAILKENNIAYKVADDNLTISVDEDKRTEAVYLIQDSEEISGSEKFTMSQLLKNDMTTTNYDKQLHFNLYYQSELTNVLENQEGIDKATVRYMPTDNRTSLLETEKEIPVSIFLQINDKFKKKTAEAIAVTVANAVGNATTEKIKVIDQYGNLLYNGPDNPEEDYASATLEYTKEVEEYYSELVTRFALMNGFSYAEPSFHLDINFDKKTEEFRQYLAAEGQEQGLYQTWSKISSENKGTSGDIPGTDSNDDVDYYIKNESSGDSSYEEINISYLPSEKLTTTVSNWPIVNIENCSVAIALKRVKEESEDSLKAKGLLTDVSYEDYVLQNSDPVDVEVSPEWKTFFSHVTGIAEDNISVTIQEVIDFAPIERSETNWTLILSIILAALIIGLLVFVVFRGMSPVEVTEVEPELSVEQLLATTKENQSLDDIEFSEKSETKRMIEKFVDENPEAVANLLRNWLQDEWE